MKYFTPDLLRRYGSDDDKVASQAQDEYETVAEKYLEHLKAIEPSLPPRFREFQGAFYLHDAQLLGYTMPPWDRRHKLSLGAPLPQRALFEWGGWWKGD